LEFEFPGYVYRPAIKMNTINIVEFLAQTSFLKNESIALSKCLCRGRPREGGIEMMKK
jgi:hypothetical protein